MSYTTFVAADRAALLSGLRTFCETTLGMTVEAYSAGSYMTLSDANLSEYATLYSEGSTTDSLFCVSRHSLLTGTAPDDYDDRSAPAETNLLSEGSYPNVFCFGENTASACYVHVVMEIDDGYYRHFGFGEMEKFGTWTGGAYCYGTNIDQSTTWIDRPFEARHLYPFAAASFTDQYGGGVRVTSSDAPAHSITGVAADFAPWHVSGTFGSQVLGAGCGMYPNDANGDFDNIGMMISGWHSANPIPHNNRLLLGAPNFFCTVDGGMRPIGTVHNIRWTSIEGLSPKEEITIASDTWKLFPLNRKGDYDGLDEEGSKNMALAYKKVT